MARRLLSAAPDRMSTELVRGYVTVAGIRVSYLGAPTLDTAPAVLLIHGSGVSARYWEAQIRGLAPAARPLAIDLPGHGESAELEGATIEDYAAVAARVVAALDAGPVVAVGHSLGGAVALALAAHHPEFVRGIVLLSSCARLPRIEPAGQWLLPLLPGPLRRALFVMAARRLLFAPSASGHAVSLGLQELRACRPGTLARDIALARSMDLASAARGVRVPALIVCGSADRITPVALSTELHRLIPGSRMAVVEGAGHMLQIEAPRRVNDEILEFAASLSDRSRAALASSRWLSTVRRWWQRVPRLPAWLRF